MPPKSQEDQVEDVQQEQNDQHQQDQQEEQQQQEQKDQQDQQDQDYQEEQYQHGESQDEQNDELAQLQNELNDLNQASTELSGVPTSAAAAAPGRPNYDPSAQAEVDQRSCFLGNVDYSVTEEDLRTFFQPLSISRITIPHDQSGRSKGYAYIEFSTSDDSTQALLLSDRDLKGRNISIQTKRTNTAGVSRSRGRGGRGGRGGFTGGRGAPHPHMMPHSMMPFGGYNFYPTPPPMPYGYGGYAPPPQQGGAYRGNGGGGYGGHRGGSGGHRGGNGAPRGGHNRGERQ